MFCSDFSKASNLEWAEANDRPEDFEGALEDAVDKPREDVFDDALDDLLDCDKWDSVPSDWAPLVLKRVALQGFQFVSSDLIPKTTMALNADARESNLEEDFARELHFLVLWMR